MEFVNLKTIADKIKRHPLMQDISFETIIDYTVDFIRIVGTPASFFQKESTIIVKDYRGELPCDFHKVIQIKNKKGTCLIYSLGTFKPTSSITYKIKGNFIFLSKEEEELTIVYEALPIDEEGIPVVPDNSIYTRALESYIKLQWFTILFDMNKISGAVLQNAQQQYAWNVGQAQTDLIMPTIDQMQAITNMWNKFVDTDYHNKGFSSIELKQDLIKH